MAEFVSGENMTISLICQNKILTELLIKEDKILLRLSV